MKDKRTIAYKSERIRRIAYSLRELLISATMREWSQLGDLQTRRNKSRMEKISIEDKRNLLYKALDDSICMCSGCQQAERDMVYNASLGSWYCTRCSQMYRDFYNKNFSKNEKDLFYESFF